MKSNKGLVIFAVCTFLVSFVYFLSIYSPHAVHTEHETWLSEIGEGFGVVGLWGLLVIYGRTIFKLALHRGKMLQRFVPDDLFDPAMSLGRKILYFLTRTHPFVGVAVIAAIFLHASLVKIPRPNLFFTLILILLFWQGVFGFFLIFRYPLKQLKRYSYLVHAQLFTGIMIGILALFGHLLVGD
jgi:preprotein translocase subunit YajC